MTWRNDTDYYNTVVRMMENEVWTNAGTWTRHLHVGPVGKARMDVRDQLVFNNQVRRLLGDVVIR